MIQALHKVLQEWASDPTKDTIDEQEILRKFEEENEALTRDSIREMNIEQFKKISTKALYAFGSDRGIQRIMGRIPKSGICRI